MRVLCLLKDPSYRTIIDQANRQSGFDIDFANDDNIAGFFEDAVSYSLILIEADAATNTGITIAKALLQHSPIANIILFMKECRFEYSMIAMRIGIKNILIQDEINVGVILEIFHAFSGSAGDNIALKKENIKRTFERLIFQHADADKHISFETLNRLFALAEKGEKYFVLMMTSLDFMIRQNKADPFNRKILNETVSEYLMAFQDKDIEIHFVFYIDDMFYIVLTSKCGPTLSQENLQTNIILTRLYEYAKKTMAENIMLLCTRPKIDFKDIDKCIKELDKMKSSLHLGRYPYLASYATTKVIEANESNFNRAVDLAVSLFKGIENDEEFADRAEKLFSPDVMKGISYDQLLKLKEYLRFEFELLRSKRGDTLLGNAEYDAAIADLSLRSNAEHTLHAVLALAKAVVSSSQKKYNFLITKCIKFIGANYAFNIGLYDAAKKLNISTVYLSQLFKKETGMNFNAYVNEYRLNQAKKLIDEGKYKMSQIGEMVGFNNTQYFSNCFKKMFQMTPVEYKNRGNKA